MGMRSRTTAAVVALLLASGARAQEAAKPDLAPAPEAGLAPKLVLTAEPPPPPKNRTIAILEGPIGTNLVMNLGGRIFKSEDSYDSTLDTIWDNITGEWEYDPNGFRTNQFAHPYQGSFYMTAGRSLGVGFWESFVYTGVGAWVWEVAGEIHPPSVNDQITTTVGGAFFGEMLYRMSSRILDDGGDRPGGWRELGAGLISPMNGINRQFYGNRYRDRRMKDIPLSGEIELAVSLGGRDDSTGTKQEVDPGNVRALVRGIYGLPDESGWRFRRPFDHFDVIASLYFDRNTFTNRSGANLLIRGLLLAPDFYGKGISSGLYGLWGVYDVITTGELRASTSAFAFGTVGQLAPSRDLRLQGTAYLGGGFGAAGTNVQVEDKRDYHFGLQAIGLVEGKVLWANRVRFRAAVREYVTGDELSPDQGGYEDMTYGIADLTVRVWGRHALGLDMISARRKARYPEVPDLSQRFYEFAVTYALVSERSLGAGRALD